MNSESNFNMPSSFEDGMTRIEEINRRLENETIPLDESLRLYQEAVAISNMCNNLLTKFERQIETIKESSDGIELVEMKKREE